MPKIHEMPLNDDDRDTEDDRWPIYAIVGIMVISISVMVWLILPYPH